MLRLLMEKDFKLKEEKQKGRKKIESIKIIIYVENIN